MGYIKRGGGFLIVHLTETCERIWSGYKLYASTAFVSRSGYELTGMAIGREGLDVADIFEWRGESVLEHQAKVAWLVTAFRDNFPRYFTTDDPRYLTVALTHDVGEVEVGDIADDGNPKHGTKDAEELRVFQKLAETYGLEGTRFVSVFKQFQEKQVRNGQALYALDKIEYVLMQIFLESHGKVGRLTKKPYETDLDSYFMKITGTDCPVDNCAAHLKWALRNCHDAVVTEPIFTLIRAAVKDVRGKDFEWWDGYDPTDIPSFKG